MKNFFTFLTILTFFHSCIHLEDDRHNLSSKELIVSVRKSRRWDTTSEYSPDLYNNSGYNRLNVLRKYAPNELLNLMDHPSPAVRLYAIDYLRAADINLLPWFEKQIKDRRIVFTQGGCIVTKDPYNIAFLIRLSNICPSRLSYRHIQAIRNCFSDTEWEKQLCQNPSLEESITRVLGK